MTAWTIALTAAAAVVVVGTTTTAAAEHDDGSATTAAQPVCLANPDAPHCQEAPPPPLNDNNDPDKPCRLYLAASPNSNDGDDAAMTSLFAGVDLDTNMPLTTPQIVLNFVDVNRNEFHPWHDLAWAGYLNRYVHNEHDYLVDSLVPGIGSLGVCSRYGQVVDAHLDHMDLSLTRATDAMAGAMSSHGQQTFVTIQPVQAGEEIFLACDGADDTDDDAASGGVPTHQSDPHWRDHAVCIDTMDVQPSTIAGAGRGAFARQRFPAGRIVTTSPVLHFSRSQVEIMAQRINTVRAYPNLRDHDIEYTDQVVRQQLILNYCFEHPDSNVLLLPYGPGVNYINHDSAAPNVAVRWSAATADTPALYHAQTPHQLFALSTDHTLRIDYVALRDINVGEELLLDYGQAFAAALATHQATWQAEADYVSAEQVERDQQQQPIRTVSEQVTQPYPANVRTACVFSIVGMEADENDYVWAPSDFHCLRPCEILERNDQDEYHVRALPIVSHMDLAHCDLPQDDTDENDGVTVRHVARAALSFLNAPYTGDADQANAFRHAMDVLPGMQYPRLWMRADPKPQGDMAAVDLEPNELAPIRWADTGKVVTPWAFQIELARKVRDVLKVYCDRMGIRDIFHHVTIGDNSLPPDGNEYVNLHNYTWYLQRPSEYWASNLHWLSPGDETSHEHYLAALGAAGLDDALQGIGKYLNMDGLVVFHVTFIAVSWSTKGFIHYDVTNTSGKTYNMIVPLELADETGPELDLTDSDRVDPNTGELAVGRYRYQYERASMMGDDAYHATSATDYRHEKKFRMAATIYMADVNKENAQYIMNEYTQAYPPRELQLLLSWAGRHWKKNDESVKLPQPGPDHILYDLVQGASTTAATEEYRGLARVG